MSKELKFANETEALQHLANITGKIVKIAKSKEKSFKLYIDEDWTYGEVEITGKYSYDPAEEASRNNPYSPESMEWWDVKMDGKDFDIDKLNAKDKKNLEERIEAAIQDDVEMEYQKDQVAKEDAYDFKNDK